MSSIDPGKLKVVELRAELSARGLDAKGNKPVLVKRLKEALEKELEAEIPDTSIADTSTEDINTSQESITEDVQTVLPDKEESLPPPDEEKPAKPSKIEVEDAKEEEEPPKVTQVDDASSEECVAQDDNQELQEQNEEPEPTDEPAPAVVSENGEDVDQEMQEDAKSDKAEPMEAAAEDEPEAKPTTEEPKGEKRRRSSPSPERVQRRRSKSPIKEDEPPLDNNKVQLSWYDSDLHLQVDKKSFLSGKPYHEGAFGFAWAGVRATHGVKSGKVCFEVKITEELKWEDIVKQSEKRRDSHRSESSRRERQKSERDSSKSDRENSRSEHESSKPDNEPKVESEKEEKPEVPTEAKEEENSDSQETDAKIKKDDEEEQGDEDNEKKEEKQEPMEAKEESGDAKQESIDAKLESTEVKQESMEVDETPAEPIAKHLFRVGWSMVDSVLQLGEAEYSYGYESSGKFVVNKEFTDYGIKFGVGDVVGAYMDLGDDSITFTFTVNGEVQPQATSVPRSDLPEEDFALFPHVLTRNFSFELNLGAREEPWFPHPSELTDYAYLEAVEDKILGPSRPETRNECEVIMMCGLPASGKTHWVRQLVKDNPDKRYTVIGNSHLLEKMTVNGNPLKNSYKGRWNVILDRLMKCVNVLVEAAALRRRNFVIDQQNVGTSFKEHKTNVFPSAQRRKMRLFEGFKRRAVVVVVGDEEQAKRRAQQEAQDGKDVPDSAILEMKANMSLPRRGEWLEEVSYVELGEEEAKALIQKYNQQGREAGFGPISGQRSGYRDNRGHPYRWDHSTSRRDYRGGYRDNRSYQNNRYDRPRQHGGWQNRRPPPGSWNRDIRRDNRGPPSGSRDFRNNNRSPVVGSGRQDRPGNRDNRNRSQSSGNFNRNQRSQNNRSQPANWQGGSGGGSWQNQGNWGGQGMWNQGNWGQGGWGGQAQQWKGSYGGQGGYGQGGYGNYTNWNYYGQYPQNWSSQGQPQTTTAGGSAASDSTNAAYGQYSQQAAWAQYAQQYAQGQATATQQPSTQK